MLALGRLEGFQTTSKEEGTMNSDHDNEEEIFPFQSSSQFIEKNPSPFIDRALNQGCVFEHHEAWESFRGDLQKQGFLIVRVYLNNALVGRASFHAPPTTWIECRDVEVAPEHQRKGIATAMYVFAEKIFRLPLRNVWGKAGQPQTELAALFWANPNQPFGKS
jgi:GNAT superfamily N-acetyltransferase